MRKLRTYQKNKLQVDNKINQSKELAQNAVQANVTLNR